MSNRPWTAAIQVQSQKVAIAHNIYRPTDNPDVSEPRSVLAHIATLDPADVRAVIHPIVRLILRKLKGSQRRCGFHSTENIIAMINITPSPHFCQDELVTLVAEICSNKIMTHVHNQCQPHKCDTGQSSNKITILPGKSPVSYIRSTSRVGMRINSTYIWLQYISNVKYKLPSQYHESVDN